MCLLSSSACLFFCVPDCFLLVFDFVPPCTRGDDILRDFLLCFLLCSVLPPSCQLPFCFHYFNYYFVLQLEGFGVSSPDLDAAAAAATIGFDSTLTRTSGYMTHPVFNTHHSEVPPRIAGPLFHRAYSDTKMDTVQ